MVPIQSQNVSSLSHQNWTKDVFLSFRGEDTRKTFVSHLHKALDTRGLLTFKDDRNLEIGDSIPEVLCSVIRKSRCAVVVISENYATSSWCLEELRQIMELHQNKEIKVVPIFYEVNPSDVRHQQGNFALERHHGPEMAEKILKWKKALTGIANKTGKESTNFEDDAAMIEDIVEAISSRLLTMSPINFDDIVGMEAHMECLMPLLEMDSKDDARIIGITGMGGIGKTTIAMYLYEQLKLKFSPHYCFIENVVKFSEKLDGLLDLQRRMLSVIFREKNLKLESVEHGRQQLEFRLRNVRVFLVLDNVDDANQLYALANEVKWFGPGSRVIITTRCKILLNSCGVETVYDVKYLDDENASKLFTRIAFKKGHLPTCGYADLLTSACRLSQGLPLALKALGASLYGKSTMEWPHAFKSFETVPYSNLDKVLKRSCSSLDESGKSAFLKIAYRFNGHPLRRVISLIDDGEDEVVVLAEKSLIDISADGRIIMHGLVKENGKHISTQRRNF